MVDFSFFFSSNFFFWGGGVKVNIAACCFFGVAASIFSTTGKNYWNASPDFDEVDVVAGDCTSEIGDELAVDDKLLVEDGLFTELSSICGRFSSNFSSISCKFLIKNSLFLKVFRLIG